MVAPEPPLEHLDQIEQRQNSAGPSTDIECLLRDLVGRAECGLVSAQQIIDMQHVAHLLAVAEDGDVLPEH